MLLHDISCSGLFWSLPVVVLHSLQVGCRARLQSDRNAQILSPRSGVQAGNPHPSFQPCRGGTAGSGVQIVANFHTSGRAGA